LEQALQQTDPRYSITKSGELKHGGNLYGIVEINLPDEDLFGEELSELKESVEEAIAWVSPMRSKPSRS
jgi:hypothetical protein